MKINTISVDGQTYRKQDFLDLILFLQDKSNSRIIVDYSSDKKVQGSNVTEYVKNIHDNNWIMIMKDGKKMNQKIRVEKEKRQNVIKYI